ncbi:MAG: tRNA glutamyl-Q(34) synthetase GluQRS [Gammaproteobacteria bacterium]|nr:tRNA glutamyl-Q(34) synthetase GluQRS [Gammaproteobacteria bacterium]
MAASQVIGRFAPTPSGALHFGSLVTALASYCQAKSQQGKWLIRIEDVDTPRNVAGSADEILFALEAFGFEWDGAVEYQSQQFEEYQSVLDQLFVQGNCYACECSRLSLREIDAQSGRLGLIYPGICRDKKLDQTAHSIRVNTANSANTHFTDQVYGAVTFDIEQASGDFVVRRADGIFAYHLAAVIDDERQHVNQVVRGADLLEATCLHLFLQQLLGYQAPEYWHIPLLRNPQGDKLSKQTGATAIQVEKKVQLLITALETLRQPVDRQMQQASVTEILQSAVESWNHCNIEIPPGDIY